MNLEVKKDSTHTFNFPDDVFGTEYWNKNQNVVISTATIEITKGGGESIVAETIMSIDTDLYNASYSWVTTEDLGENYIVKFKINGIFYNRFFDIYYYPFQNTVTDNDLFLKDNSIKRDSYCISGKANSGSTTTLIDTNRLEDDGYFEGGLIELYFEDKIEVRNVTAYLKSTSTVTFSPALSFSIVTDLGYSIRESFQYMIDEAAKETKERFQQVDRRPYLLIDHSQMKSLIIWKTLAHYYVNRRKEEGDEYDLKFVYYTNKFETYFQQTVWKYDKSFDGHLDPGEDNENTKIKWHR